MISMISGEGESIKPYINFYDWDGTLLHQYTLSEFANLEALPELPDNLPGHTAVEWNYDMETILAMQSHVNVGAIYNQNDTEEVAETPKQILCMWTAQNSICILLKKQRLSCTSDSQ